MTAIMLDFAGVELTSEDKEILKHPQVGGIILFSRNYESKQQLQYLTKSIRKLAPECLIAVDQEGGRVQRFKTDFTRLPAFDYYGKLYQQNKQAGLNKAEEYAFIMAKELIDVGVNMSFSPVLDMDRGISEVIGDRSFHEEANIVINLGRAFITGMHRAGMPATGKHFPGHGAVVADSHLSLPVDERSYSEILEHDMAPFIQLKDELAAIMPAHVLYANVDSKPTCFSQFWLQQILRLTLNFEGMIFSDDLSMAGAQSIGSHVERANIALEAGCDMILVCNNRGEAIKVLDNLETYHNPVAAERLKNFRRKPS